MLKRLLIVFFLPWISSSGAQAILQASDLVSRARTLLKDASTSANRQQFSDAQYLAWASDGQREANAQNWLIQSSTTFSLTGGTTEYPMPDGFMFPTRVWFSSAGQPYSKLPSTSFNDLDARSPGWFNVSGTPQAYYVDMTTGTVYLGFYPAPVAASTGPVIAFYIQNSTDMFSTNEAVLPFNGWNALQPYASALPYYMAYRAYLVLEEVDIAKQYLDTWTQFLLIMRQGLNRQPDFNPGAGALRSGSPSSMGGLGGP
jgi:hypothetical protein